MEGGPATRDTEAGHAAHGSAARQGTGIWRVRAQGSEERNSNLSQGVTRRWQVYKTEVGNDPSSSSRQAPLHEKWSCEFVETPISAYLIDGEKEREHPVLQVVRAHPHHRVHVLTAS